MSRTLGRMAVSKSNATASEAQECDKSSCRNKSHSKCRFCKRYFCEDHSKPKLTGSLSYISSLKDKDLKEIYEEEGRGEDGHPCPNFSEEFKAKHKEQQEKALAALFDQTKDILDSIIADMRGVSGQICYMPGCNNSSVGLCQYCHRNYCNHHKRPMSSTEPVKQGHQCSAYTDHLWKKSVKL